MSDPVTLPGRHAVAEQQQRRAVQGGLGQPVDRAGQSRPAGHHYGARGSGEQAERSSHDARSGLAVREGEPDTALRGGTDHLQVRPSPGHPEQPLDPGRVQAVGETDRRRSRDV